MSLTLIAAPYVEPITLAECKAQLGINDAVQDSVLTRRITEARQFAEEYTRRAFVRQTWDWGMTAWPASSILDVPLGSLQSVDAISYWDAAGVLQILPSTEYQVDTSSLVGRIMPESGKSWPDLRAEKFNPAIVRFSAGYAPSAAASAVTAGATTAITLDSDLGLVAGDTLRLAGFAGADAALLNGLDHTINSITGVGPYVFTLATNTNAKTITVGAGVGADITAIPGPIREAILLTIGHWMNFQPGIEGAGTVTRLPYAVLDLLTAYRLACVGDA